MPIFARGPVEAAKKLEFKISELESPPLRVHSAQRDSRSHLASGSVLIKALELSWGKKQEQLMWGHPVCLSPASPAEAELKAQLHWRVPNTV